MKRYDVVSRLDGAEVFDTRTGRVVDVLPRPQARRLASNLNRAVNEAPTPKAASKALLRELSTS
jgi:hypothetical protein